MTIKIKVKKSYDEEIANGYTPIGEGGGFSLPDDWNDLTKQYEVRIIGNERMKHSPEGAEFKWCMLLIDVEYTDDDEETHVVGVRVPNSYKSLTVGDVINVGLQASRDGNRIYASIIDMVEA